jgi:hypothetical protein
VTRASSSPVDARFATVYQCPECEERFLGERRCPDCNLFTRRIDLGGPCPSCDEPVAISELACSLDAPG